jgi:uncharacterized cupin superfamily protein
LFHPGRRGASPAAPKIGKQTMRKGIVAVLAVIALGAPASAGEWTLVSQDGFSKIYVDSESPKHLADGSVSVRALTDYDPGAAEAASFRLSDKGLSEIETAIFDCGAGKFRSEGGSWFAGHMATGAVRSDYPARSEWSTTPGFYRPLLARLCAK